MQQPVGPRWRQAIEAGELGVWDLRPELETVQYSPQWKQRLGFPAPEEADRMHFWRCRVHPHDIEGMLAGMHRHMHGGAPVYEATFRLRSNGSGYRLVHSRGRIIERDARGGVLRMVGTMIDLSEHPCVPRGGLPDGPRGPMAGLRLALPLHLLLGVPRPASASNDEDGDETQIALERERVLGMVEDLLHAAVEQLEGCRAL